MPLWAYPLIIALAAPTMLFAGAWLVWHSADVAAACNGRWGIISGKVRRRAGGREVRMWLTAVSYGALFLGTGAVLAVARAW